MTQAEAALAVGATAQTVSVSQQRYRQRGEDVLLDGSAGVAAAWPGAADGGGSRQDSAPVAAQTPDALDSPFGLLARCANELQRRFEKRLAPSTVRLYLTLAHDTAKAPSWCQGALACSDRGLR